VTDADHLFEIACTTNVTGPLGRLIGWAEDPKHPTKTFRHAYVILRDCIIEAAPGGVRIMPLDTWTGAGVTVYSDFQLTEFEQPEFERVARAELHAPYDYLGDVIVGLDGLWLGEWKQAAARGRLEDRPRVDFFRMAELIEDRAHRMWFCSAYADYVMSSFRPVFKDGRPRHAVNPHELALRLINKFPAVNAGALQKVGLA